MATTGRSTSSRSTSSRSSGTRRTRLACASLALLCSLAAPPPALARATAAASQAAPLQSLTTTDGIAAVVNDEIISIGEVRRAALLRRDERTAGLASGCGLGPVVAGSRGASESTASVEDADDPAAAPDLHAALECLIDAVLVFREVRRFPQLGVSADEVRSLMTQLEENHGSAAALDDYLRSVGLLRSEVRADLQRQLLVAAYIDTRFRATVEISDEEARRAWAVELVPDMQARGIAIPDYAQVADELVVPLLREREVNRRVQSWIGDLRQRATIDRRFP